MEEIDIKTKIERLIRSKSFELNLFKFREFLTHHFVFV